MEPFKTVKSRRVEATRRNKRPTMFDGAVDCREHVHARRRLGQVVLARWARAAELARPAWGSHSEAPRATWAGSVSDFGAI
jgi:hypothetical protein